MLRIDKDIDSFTDFKFLVIGAGRVHMRVDLPVEAVFKYGGVHSGGAVVGSAYITLVFNQCTLDGCCVLLELDIAVDKVSAHARQDEPDGHENSSNKTPNGCPGA